MMEWLLVVLLAMIAILSVWIYVLTILGKRRREYSKQLLDENESVLEFFKLKQTGGIIKEYLDDRGYNKIAVWGIGRLGKLIFRELLNEGINIVCCIDDTINNHYDIDVDVYYPLEKELGADAVLCIFPLPSRWENAAKEWGVPSISIYEITRELMKKS